MAKSIPPQSPVAAIFGIGLAIVTVVQSVIPLVLVMFLATAYGAVPIQPLLVMGVPLAAMIVAIVMLFRGNARARSLFGIGAMLAVPASGILSGWFPQMMVALGLTGLIAIVVLALPQNTRWLEQRAAARGN